MKQTKIAYCVPAIYYPSGMERVLIQKANYLIDKGYEVHIIITDGKNKAPFYKIHPDIIIHQLDVNFEEIDHLPLHKRFFKYRRKQKLFKQKLNSCLLQIRPDITISLLRRDVNFINQMSDGSIKIGEIHFDKFNYRSLNHTNIPSFIQKSIQYIWMQQLIRELKKMKKFVVLTYEDQKEWTELTNTTVIHNPLSIYPEDQSTCESKQVIAVGRYTYQKGFDLLIKAWALVEKEHPDWTLRIYGGGEKREYQDLLDSLQIHTCFLEGPTSHIVEKYLESSLFVLSSRYEGFGLVLAEAMACGLPTVSFTCPCGPKDIISEGTDGFLVENGNIEEMAKRICFLIENDFLRKKMGKNAKENARRFLPENIMPKWISLFENLLSSKREKK